MGDYCCYKVQNYKKLDDWQKKCLFLTGNPTIFFDLLHPLVMVLLSENHGFFRDWGCKGLFVFLFPVEVNHSGCPDKGTAYCP